jgi:uncharacterized protein involved in exopolysaccharide biosynthesis
MTEITTAGPSAVSPSKEAPRKTIPFFTAIRRHPLAAVVGTVVVFSVGYAALAPRMVKVYTSESVVYVSPTFPKELADDREHERIYDDFMQQQIAAIPQYDTLRAAIEAYPTAWMRPGENEQTAVERLRKALKVSQVGHSYLISIALTSTHTAHLADLVNKITEDYIERAHDEEFFGRKARLETLRDDLAKQESLLQAKRAEQAELLDSVGMAHYDSQALSNPYDEQMSKLRDQLADAHAKRAEAEARLAQVHVSGTAIQLDEQGSSEVNSDPMLASMRTQVGSQHATLEAQEAGLTEKSELRQMIQRNLKSMDAAMEKSIEEERRKKALEILARYRLESARAATLESSLSSDLRQTMRQAATATPILQKAEAINADIDNLQAEYNKVATRIHDLTLEGSSPGSIHLDTAALQPLDPDASKKALMLGLLGLFSLLGGPAAAVLAFLMEEKVYSTGDVVRVLGISPIAALLDPSQYPEEVEQEFFLRLAGGVESAYRRTGARSFVFTTVGTQSPKNLVLRLAKALSRSGLKTVVLDAPVSSGGNLPKPDRDKLQAGSVNEQYPEPAETSIGKQNVGSSVLILESLRQYDIVLIAGESLLTSASTENLTRTCDVTVMVIKSGVSTKNQIKRAAAVLERVNVPGIAVVVSDIDKKNADRETVLSVSDYEAVLNPA